MALKVIDIRCDNIQTTDDAWTTVTTYPVTTDTVVLIEFHALGLLNDSSIGGIFVLRGGFRNDGGVISEIDSQTVTDEFSDDNQWDVQCVISGTDLLMQVKGNLTQTINWQGETRVHSWVP